MLLTLHPQTELAINTHVTVTDTHTMVTDIHRTIVQGQEGNGSKHPSVSDIHTLAITEQPLIGSPGSDQVSNLTVH